MNKRKTVSTIKKNPLNYLKSKMVAEMVYKGMDKNQIFNECFNENRIDIKSLERRREVTNEIYRRISNLDSYLIKEFLEQDIITSKLILIYAIAKTDDLFFEFLVEVYRNTILGDKQYISMDDFDHFFQAKKETDLVVSKWSTTTIEQLAKGYRKLLIDASLGVRNIKNIYVTKPMIHPSVMKHIEKIGDYKYLQAILGER
ncbi:DUF1819 family protein [Erysipelothrix rhusiopathiae]|nr:DUF1819 family protein [Erysipelothrix rhusiopathiae]